jgi:hypothetical protein
VIFMVSPVRLPDATVGINFSSQRNYFFIWFTMSKRSESNGEPGATRTHDQLLKRQLLYQLSYGPKAPLGGLNFKFTILNFQCRCPSDFSSYASSATEIVLRPCSESMNRFQLEKNISYFDETN